MHVPLGIVIMMGISRQMMKFLLVIPTQNRYIGEKLVSIIYVSSIIVHADLKLSIFLEQHGSDLEKKLFGREFLGLYHPYTLTYRMRLHNGDQRTQ